MKKMTPQEALSILDQAASRAQLSRADHVAVQQAVQVLAEVIHPQGASRPKEEQKKEQKNE
ncbi:MAG: hypothetical protein CL609_23840 [Anaerolineaceae bacterium]|nr:hypothetical protein [Anaerolineaceae bacterium]